jgi:hypothetical protein
MVLVPGWSECDVDAEAVQAKCAPMRQWAGDSCLGDHTDTVHLRFLFVPNLNFPTR